MQNERSAMKNNQMLETDRSPNGIPAVCGVVKFAGRDYGFLTSVEGTEKDVWFSRNNVCGVRAGGSNPLLVDGDGQVPLFPGTVVVLLEPFDNGRGGLMTDGLCRKVAFDGVSREIANRPYYRLWHSANRWANGKFIASGNQPYAEETLESLEAKFPRGVQNDPLAPGYATGPVKVAAVKWEKRTPTGGWEICEDPRPLPAHLNPTIRVMRLENAEPREVWVGSLQRFTALPGFKSDQFWFEKKAGDGQWMEIADPRTETEPKPKAVKAPAITATAQPKRKKADKPAKAKGSGQTAPTGISVAPPKKEKAEVTVKGLEALSL